MRSGDLLLAVVHVLLLCGLLVLGHIKLLALGLELARGRQVRQNSCCVKQEDEK